MSTARVAQAIQPVRKLKVSDAVAAQLEKLIISGEYAVGDRLPSERELASRFGVGRSSMREALRMVEAMGLLRTAHGVGAFVARVHKISAPISELLVIGDFTVDELFEVRVNLESLAAGRAAERRAPEELAALEEILDLAEDPRISDERFVKLDAQFHRGVAAASHNRLLAEMFERVMPHFLAYSHRVIELPQRRENAHRGHREIAEAISNKRVRDARSSAVSHIREVEQDIVGFLSQG